MPTLIESIAKDFKLAKKDLNFVRTRCLNKNSLGVEKISKSLSNY